jgi:hypothetical protein
MARLLAGLVDHSRISDAVMFTTIEIASLRSQ